MHGRWRRLLGLGLVAGSLIGGSGCLTLGHSIDPPHPDSPMPCHTLPQPCRSHVFVFLIHSVDPLDCANLTGVRDYLFDLGFTKTYYGQVYHTGWFEKEIRRIHHDDPDARFVLVGYGVGAKKARTLAETVQDQHIAIDLLVYLSGGSHLGDGPANVRRVVNLAEGKGTHLDGADNIRVVEMKHHGTPTHAATLDVLASELTAVALTVPVPVRPTLPAPPAIEEGPTPRPVAAPQVTTERDEWDFLKPVTRLSLGERPALPPAAPKLSTEQTVTTEEP